MTHPRRHGSELLAEFIAKTGLRASEAAAAVKVARSGMSQYLSRKQNPRPHERNRIAKWTRGFVPFGSWDDEDPELAKVRPFRAGERSHVG